jgi:hypothetical protein
MWYAPIGSLEYAKIIHNDILIKRYILSEQRWKQQQAALINKKTLDTKGKKKDSKKKRDILEVRKNRIKGCAVDVIIKRSYRQTMLNVVTYDSTKRSR